MSNIRFRMNTTDQFDAYDWLSRWDMDATPDLDDKVRTMRVRLQLISKPSLRARLQSPIAI